MYSVTRRIGWQGEKVTVLVQFGSSNVLKVPYYEKHVFSGGPPWAYEPEWIFYIDRPPLRGDRRYLRGRRSSPRWSSVCPAVRQQCFTMSSLKARHANSSVVGCKNQHQCLYSVPATEQQKTQWLHFIFNDSVPASVHVSLYVCANHFTSDCFSNEGQYKAGFASTLTLVKGSVPTIPDPVTAPEPQVSVAAVW